MIYLIFLINTAIIMRDLSLHLLDVVQNSVKAKSTLVTISIEIDENGKMKVTVLDDGCGMSKEMVEQVTNPFFTTRTTREVGLGIPLLMENAKRTCGDMHIESTLGEGTKIVAEFDTKHIDALPLGNMGQTIATLCACYPTQCDFIFTYTKEEQNVHFDTREVKEVLQEVPINSHEVLVWIEQSVQEEMKEQL
ncbi:MAG: ATP-binding protein [Clostridiales bacterium]|nr:ATP-binding protein [Clostridiales bacterium]